MLAPMTRNGLARLLVVHGFITLAAGFALIGTPPLIPRTVGIHLADDAYLIAYLLAGAEIGFAVLSFGGSRLEDPRALRLIVWSCIAFHGSSAVLETYSYIRGVNIVVLGNIAARLSFVGLFVSSLRNLRVST